MEAVEELGDDLEEMEEIAWLGFQLMLVKSL